MMAAKVENMLCEATHISCLLANKVIIHQNETIRKINFVLLLLKISKRLLIMSTSDRFIVATNLQIHIPISYYVTIKYILH